MSRSHTMKGQDGYGLTHGLRHDLDGDPGVPTHEFRGAHGVSRDWISKRVNSGVASAKGARVAKFTRKMQGGFDRTETKSPKAARKYEIANDTAFSAARRKRKK